MVNTQFHNLESMWSAVRWTPEEESIFVHKLVNSENKGHLFRVGRQRDDLEELANEMTSEIGKHFSLKKVINKFKGLRARYNLWEKVRLWDGVELNSLNDRFDASDEVWDAILKEHPSACKIRDEGDKYWFELQLIFTGHFVNEVDDFQNRIVQQLPTTDTIIVISDNEDNHVNEHTSAARDPVGANVDIIEIEDSEGRDDSHCSSAYSSNVAYLLR